MTDPTPPTESPQTLEERLLTDFKLLRKSLDRHFRGMVAEDVMDARAELARLRAEVARLTAERDAAEARAARLEEALEEALEAQRFVAEDLIPCLREMIAGGVSIIDDFTTKVWRGVETVDQLLARRVLNPEGADHAD